METTSVLVVENNSLQRLLYEEELEDEGYQVWLAADGREALHIVHERHPDLVILDLHLPEVDGPTVLRHLRDRDPTLPVIIYSAGGSYRDPPGPWRAHEYLVKSSDLRPLKAAIQRVLNSRAGFVVPP
jgi:CheY-like chemotaxis protein